MAFIIFSGCSCFAMERFEYEAFANEEEPFFTKEEQELFENITKGNMSDKEIKELISSKVIGENLISKFLKKLDKMTLPTDEPKPKSKPKPKKGAAAPPPPPKKKEEPKKKVDDVEPFCGSDKPYAASF